MNGLTFFNECLIETTEIWNDAKETERKTQKNERIKDNNLHDFMIRKNKTNSIQSPVFTTQLELYVGKTSTNFTRGFCVIFMCAQCCVGSWCIRYF